MKEIKYYCLVMSEKYIRNHFDDLKKYANIIENRLEDGNFDLESAIKDNIYHLENCKKFDCKYILIDDEYEINVELF